MTQIQKAVLLAAAMIGAALLAVAGIVPEEIAQWAPLAMFAMLAIFPSAWLGKTPNCGAKS